LPDLVHLAVPQMNEDAPGSAEESVADLGPLFKRSIFLRPLQLLGAQRLERLLYFDRLNRDVRRWAEVSKNVPVFEAAMQCSGLTPVGDGPGADTIPATGALVVVSNHPFGGAEALVLGALLERVRSDIKIMVTDLVRRIGPIRPNIITVDSFGRWNPTGANTRPLRESLLHLKRGGVLVVFPAGRVAHFQIRRMAVTDADWTPQVIRIIQAAKAPVQPVFVHGRNPAVVNFIGLVHPLLRTVLLCRALYRTFERKVVRCTFGDVIPADVFQGSDPAKAIQDLRERVERLRLDSSSHDAHLGGAHSP
jgi:1-acyl-sn-glycerol-3-phosphate acyltransferase